MFWIYRTHLIRKWNWTERTDKNNSCVEVWLYVIIFLGILYGWEWLISRSWTAVSPPVLDRSIWSDGSRGSRTIRNSDRRCNATSGCTSCRIPSWCTPRCPATTTNGLISRMCYTRLSFWSDPRSTLGSISCYDAWYAHLNFRRCTIKEILLKDVLCVRSTQNDKNI